MYSKNRALADQVLAHSDILTIDPTVVASTVPAMVERLGGIGCLRLNSQYAVKTPSLRAGLAEAAYLKMFKSAPVPTSGKSMPRTFVAKNDDLLLARAYAEIADCVVDKNVAGADELVRTGSHTPEEAASSRRLALTFSNCLPGGLVLHLNSALVRAIAVDGLWQKYVAGASAGSATRGFN